MTGLCMINALNYREWESPEFKLLHVGGKDAIRLTLPREPINTGFIQFTKYFSRDRKKFSNY